MVESGDGPGISPIEIIDRDKTDNRRMNFK